MPWCVIPAAGEGTRMGRLTAHRPKPLLRIDATTLLGRILADVTRVARDVCVVIAPDDEMIRDELGSRWRGARLHYVVQHERRGVGHAVCRAAEVVTGPFAVVMGDAYYEDPLAPRLVEWRDGGDAGAVLVEEIVDPPPDPIGLVRVRDGRVVALRKAARSRSGSRFTHRVGGAVFFPLRAFESCEDLEAADTGELEVEDLVSDLLARGVTFRAIPYAGWRRNVNTPEDLEEVRNRARRNRRP